MSRSVRLVTVLFIAILAWGGLSLSAMATSGDTSGTDGAATGTSSDLPIKDSAGNVIAPAANDDYVKALADQVGHNRISLNIMFLMVCGLLVFFMQAGFALVETGFCRSKHATHVVMTNFVIFSLGMLGYALIGYPLMFGSQVAPAVGLLTPAGAPLLKFGSWVILGQGGWFFAGQGYDVGFMAFFFFQLVFMDTMATIPTGAMAERWKFSGFTIYGLLCGTLFYPIFGNWVWGGGWLSQLGAMGPKLGHGAVDFAGSGVVHAVGGVTALTGAIVLGPRLGKFGKNGEVNTLRAHNIPMAVLGCFILMFGWFGFNGGSTFAATETRFAIVVVNTFLAGMVGSLTAMFLAWWGPHFGKPDPGMAINGFLAGLVAITAPCAFVAPWAACVIGGAAGFLVYYAVLTIERKFKIDDPVGAIAVHGVNGLWGVLAVGLFADGTYGEGWNGVPGTVKGLLYGDGKQLIAQVIDVVVLVVFIGIITYVAFKIIDKTAGLRASPEDELAGLDLTEMGPAAYVFEDGTELVLDGGQSEPVPVS